MADLVEIHCETLYVLDGRGDMVSDNNPFPPERRGCCRLHLGWNDRALTYRFRRDVPRRTRDRFVAWLERHSPVGRERPSGLGELGGLFGVAADRIAAGPAYYAATDPPPVAGVTAVGGENAHCLPAGYLQEDEIDRVQPCYAVVAGGRALSVCVTVRRSGRGIEAGVDTEPDCRGRGYAGRVTAAWIAAARAEGLIPFYSTESDNLASRRVAEKLGLVRFAWELGVR